MGIKPFNIILWLALFKCALNQNKQFHDELLSYEAFTDIEFNPNKSINCQTYSVAMFVSLAKRNLLENIREPAGFLKVLQWFPTE